MKIAAEILVKCDGCGASDERDEVRTTVEYWTAWGRNCFDFNWQKNKGEISLCGECEEKEWKLCNDCCALIDAELYGTGYPEEYGYNDEYRCPECMIKAGYELEVSISLPNPSKGDRHG